MTWTDLELSNIHLSRRKIIIFFHFKSEKYAGLINWKPSDYINFWQQTMMSNPNDIPEYRPVLFVKITTLNSVKETWACISRKERAMFHRLTCNNIYFAALKFKTSQKNMKLQFSCCKLSFQILNWVEICENPTTENWGSFYRHSHYHVQFLTDHLTHHVTPPSLFYIKNYNIFQKNHLSLFRKGLS